MTPSPFQKHTRTMRDRETDFSSAVIIFCSSVLHLKKKISYKWVPLSVPSVRMTRRTPIAMPPFDSSNMFTGMALQPHSLFLLNQSELWYISRSLTANRNQSVQLVGRLVTEINGTHPNVTGSEWPVWSNQLQILGRPMRAGKNKKNLFLQHIWFQNLQRERGCIFSNYLTNLVNIELWASHIAKGGYFYSIKLSTLHRFCKHHLFNRDMLRSQLMCCRIL